MRLRYVDALDQIASSFATTIASFASDSLDQIASRYDYTTNDTTLQIAFYYDTSMFRYDDDTTRLRLHIRPIHAGDQIHGLPRWR